MTGSSDWQQWFDAHAAALVLLARQWCGNRADAEDVVQEAFIRAWRQRATITDIAAYMFATARTTAMNFVRGQRRTRQREALVSPSVSATSMFECELERDDWRRQVEAGLAQLPVDQREVLVMKIWGELTFAQIAEALDIPPNTAASRYRYALEGLRRVIRCETS